MRSNTNLRHTIKCILDVQPMNCRMHNSAEYRKMMNCEYCKFKTNTPALVRACNNSDLDTVLVFYRAGFRIITQFDTDEHHRNASSSFWAKMPGSLKI